MHYGKDDPSLKVLGEVDTVIEIKRNFWIVRFL